MTFTVLGPTGALLNPGSNSTVGATTLNGEGYLDVPFTAPAGSTIDASTIANASTVFTLSGATGWSIDTTKAPVLDLADRQHLGLPLLDEGLVHERQRRDHVPVRRLRLRRRRHEHLHRPGCARQLHRRRRRDAEHPLPRRPADADRRRHARPLVDHGHRAGVHARRRRRRDCRAARRRGADAAARARRPSATTSSGSFAPGAVTVGFVAGSFSSSSSLHPSGFTNLAKTDTFTVQQLTATLADPNAGGMMGADDLNNRSFVDVTFNLPSGAESIDISSVTDAAAEFSISSPGTLSIDTTQAPVLISQSSTAYVFRYFTTGTASSGPVSLTYVDGSVTFRDAGGQPVVPAAGTYTLTGTYSATRTSTSSTRPQRHPARHDVDRRQRAHAQRHGARHRAARLEPGADDPRQRPRPLLRLRPFRARHRQRRVRRRLVERHRRRPGPRRLRDRSS